MHQHIITIILAAGKGTRMPSSKPKALQTVLGEAMLSHVYAAASAVSSAVWTVIGHKAEMVQQHLRKEFGDNAADACVLQQEQLGTGHAVRCAIDEIQKRTDLRGTKILILNADVPLISADILENFITQANPYPLAFMSIKLDAPKSYGRVVREGFLTAVKQGPVLQHEQNCGAVSQITEAKDFRLAYPGSEIFEVNSGIYLADAGLLLEFLPQLSSTNAGGEYYLTDIIGLAKSKGTALEAVCCGNAEALLGVNTPAELNEAEKILQQEINTKLMQNGTVLHNPETIRISPFAEIAPGTEIYGPCELYGHCRIGAYSVIESHCVLKNTVIGEYCEVKSFCHFEDARTGNSVKLGPYARLRPQAVLADNVHLGNFVEIKKSTIGNGSKVNHLSYIGDSTVGSGVNVGAGCITCNYDGKNKYQTVIEDNAFLGSNCAFVAPVTIAKNTLVAAGSVITKDTEENCLAVARSRQVNIKR